MVALVAAAALACSGEVGAPFDAGQVVDASLAEQDAHHVDAAPGTPDAHVGAPDAKVTPPDAAAPPTWDGSYTITIAVTAKTCVDNGGFGYTHLVVAGSAAGGTATFSGLGLTPNGTTAQTAGAALHIGTLDLSSPGVVAGFDPFDAQATAGGFSATTTYRQSIDTMFCTKTLAITAVRL